MKYSRQRAAFNLSRTRTAIILSPALMAVGFAAFDRHIDLERHYISLNKRFHPNDVWLAASKSKNIQATALLQLKSALYSFR